MPSISEYISRGSIENFRDIKRTCKTCDKKLILNNNRDIERKKYCSHECASRDIINDRKLNNFICENCECNFQSKAVNAKRCQTCRNDKFLQVSRSYKMLNDNPEKYFQHALYKKGRENLTVEFMLNLLDKQKGKCALSGEVLTFTKVVGNGRVNTNASIDQIDAGGGYTEENVQIVCDIVNIMKSDMTIDELKFWSSKIVKS